MDKDNVSAPFSVATTNASTATTTATTSSNVNLAEQNMGYSQNVHFPHCYGPFGFPATPSPAPLAQFYFPPPPYLVPYDLSLRFPYMHTFPQVINPIPMYSFPPGQSSVRFRMPYSKPQVCSQPKEENGKIKMSKIARNKRKQARQRNRSSASGASSIKEETIKRQPVGSGEANVQVPVTQNRNNSDVFCTPDGKRLKEILTKKLKNSDVGSLGRIVLPKREAEVKLPALCDKEGIEVLLQDVYSDLKWSLKFKYWSNNNSRMYVLENTGDFVNHYELQMGDSLTLYEDELKNLELKQYVWAKKERKAKVASRDGQHPDDTYNYSYMHATYTHQAKDEEEEASLALLIEELSHKEQEAANSLLTLCGIGGGGSSSRIRYHKNSCRDEGASSQVAEQQQQATTEAVASSSWGRTTVMDDDQHQQNSLDDFHEGLDGLDTSEVGCNYLI